MPRSRVRSRAETAVTRIGRPQRSVERVVLAGEDADHGGADGAEAGDADPKGMSHGKSALDREPSGCLRERRSAVHAGPVRPAGAGRRAGAGRCG